jgi:hypothetical protein
MAELVNLRTARKRAGRKVQDDQAAANRLAHGQPAHLRKLEAARRDQASHSLDRHRVDSGDDQ